MYGRGAGDMKSGLSRRWSARARRCAGSGLEPAGRLDAAVGGRGGVRRQRRAGLPAGRATRPTPAVVVEPFGAAITTAQVGVLWFDVTRRRRTRRTPPMPATGNNAIEARCHVIRALRELEAELNEVRPPPYDAYPHPINLNVGVIQGGDWPSTVAGECVARFRLALLPGRDRGGAARPDRGGGRPRRPRRDAYLAAHPRGGHLRRVRLRGLRARGRRAAGRRSCRRPSSARRRPRPRWSRPPAPPTPARSGCTAASPASASARTPRAPTGWTSGSTCRRSCRRRRCSRCSSATGAGSMRMTGQRPNAGGGIGCPTASRRTACRTQARRPLRGISEIRRFFRTNPTPIYFVSATAFNLLGIDRWVRNFRFINYYDSFDGHHPNVFVPGERSRRARSSRSRRSATTCSATRRSWTGCVAREGGQGRVPDVRRRDRGAGAGDSAWRWRSPARRCATGSTRRSRRRGSATRRACPACPTCSAGRSSYAELTGLAADGRHRRRPGRADAVRRLRPDDVLHRQRGATGTSTPRSWWTRSSR